MRIPYNTLALDSPLSDGGGVSGGVSGGEVENDDFAAILSLVSESDGATTADIVSGMGIPKSVFYVDDILMVTEVVHDIRFSPLWK